MLIAKNTSISEIMTKEVLVLDVNDTIREVSETFRNHFLRHAPVVSNGELVGMFSLIDAKTREPGSGEDAFEFDDRYLSWHVKKLMTPDPVSVQVDATIAEVGKLFTENDFHAVPVLEGERVVGIVSTTDIIRFLLESTEE